MIRLLIILLLFVSMFVFSLACTQTDSEVHPNNDAETPASDDTEQTDAPGGIPSDISALSAPAEDLLYIEFAGIQNDDGTFEYLDSVVFVFEGEHTNFNINAIEHWGRLLSFDSMEIVEHHYTMRDEAGAHNSYSFDGKTGFVVFFGEEITKPGMYVISFDYLGEMMETELAIVIGPVN